MKNGYYLLVCLSILLVSCTEYSSVEKTYSKAEFLISGMSDNSYNLHMIEHHLNEAEGVIYAQVVEDENRVEIAFDPQQTNQKALLEVIQHLPVGASYQVQYAEVLERPLTIEKPATPELISKDVLFENISFPSIFEALVVVYRKSGGYGQP